MSEDPEFTRFKHSEIIGADEQFYDPDVDLTYYIFKQEGRIVSVNKNGDRVVLHERSAPGKS